MSPKSERANITSPELKLSPKALSTLALLGTVALASCSSDNEPTQTTVTVTETAPAVTGVPVEPEATVDPGTPVETSPVEELSPAEINAQLLESYTMDEDSVLSVRNGEAYMDDFMTDLGSTPQVVVDSEQYIESVQIDLDHYQEEGYEVLVDTGYYEQLSDSLGIYTNVLNANKDSEPEVFSTIKKGAAKDIMKDVYFTSGAVDAEDILDVSDDVVVETLTRFVETSVPEGAVISDFDVSTVRILPNPDELNNGTWADITVMESNGDTWSENVKISNRWPDIAKTLNPFEGWSVTADIGQPLQVGFNYNPEGDVSESNNF